MVNDASGTQIALVSTALYHVSVVMNRIPERPMVKPDIANLLLIVENASNLLYHLGQMAAIYNFIHNTICKLISDHITRSGIPENPMGETKIMNRRLLCSK